MLRDRTLWPGEHCAPTVWSNRRKGSTPARCGGPPKAISLQYPACPPWTDNNHTAYVPADVLVLTEYRMANDHGGSVVTPFVVTGALAADPQSIEGRSVQAMRTPWASRKLVFFAGHVPALHNSKVRYLIWRQLRRDVRATTKSHTINCTIGQYAVCRRPMRWLREQSNSFFINACKSSCGAGAPCGASEHNTPAQNLQRLLYKCKRYKTVDFQAEASDYARDAALRWSDRQYLREAMQHRFCLIARGDLPSTPKIAELLAVGAAGGCLPVFVLGFPRNSTRPSHAAVQSAMAQRLPFSSWLRYCSFSYFVSREAAVEDMPGVLRALESVSAAEAQGKLAALAKLRSVFGFQKNSTPERPSATDHIFAELCTRAKVS